MSVVLGALLAMVLVLSGTTAASAAGSCSGPIANGQIRVVIVVDPGDSGPRGPMATCLVVDAGTSGSQILAQRASQLGLPSPRYAGSGLLCGLDGFPATGCPVNNGGAYAYWAYFNGRGGSWSYGHDNPFVRRMVDGEIMGWRYTTGSADGDAPTPRSGAEQLAVPAPHPRDHVAAPARGAVAAAPESVGRPEARARHPGVVGSSRSIRGPRPRRLTAARPPTRSPARWRTTRRTRRGSTAVRAAMTRVPMRMWARSWRRHP